MMFSEIEVQGALQVKKKVPDAVLSLIPLILNEPRNVWLVVDRFCEVIAQRIEREERLPLMSEYDYA